MNVLVISNNPNRASYRQRIGIYIDSLRRSQINCEVAKLPSTEYARFKIFKLAKEFDAVFLHKKCLNFLDITCLQKYSKKIIYDIDDAVMYSSDKPQSNITSHYRKFRRTAKTADMVIAGNQYRPGWIQNNMMLEQKRNPTTKSALSGSAAKAL